MCPGHEPPSRVVAGSGDEIKPGLQHAVPSSDSVPSLTVYPHAQMHAEVEGKRALEDYTNIKRSKGTGGLHFTGMSYSFIFRVRDPITKLLWFRERYSIATRRGNDSYLGLGTPERSL